MLRLALFTSLVLGAVPAVAAPLTLDVVRPQVRIHLGPEADGIAITPGAVWAASKRPNMVSRIDPVTNRIDARIPLPGIPCAGLASGLGSLWVPMCGPRPAIVRIDLARARIQAVFAVDAVVADAGIAVGVADLWAPLAGTGALGRLDPETGRIKQRVAVPPGTLNLIVANGMVWTSSAARGRVTVLDEASGRVLASVRVGGGPGMLAAGGGAVWVLDRKDGSVERIDIATRRRGSAIAARSAGRGGDIAFGEGRVWTTVLGKPLTMIDPARGQVLARWTGPGGDSLGVDSGSVWLTDLRRGDLVRLPVSALIAAATSAKSAAPARRPRP